MRRPQSLFVGVAVVLVVGTATLSADRAHDLAKEASKQHVATCADVATLDACHPGFATGCSASQRPRYDAYLNFLKDQDPPPSLAPLATLTERDWVTKEAQLADLGLTKGNHAAKADALAGLGEGNIYTTVGYVYYRVTNSGETSNCQLTGRDNNDFHIGIGFDAAMAAQLASGKTVPDAQATSIIVEMTPQYRAQHHPKWTQAAVDALIGHEVKVVGQLIADSEHMSAKDDCGDPDAETTCWRKTVWELHPVTQFYFCPSDSCTANGSGWQPLDDSVSFTTTVSGAGGTSTGFGRLIAKSSDSTRITVAPARSSEPAVLPVASAARTQVADLKEGDTVHVTTTSGSSPQVEAIAVKTVVVSARRRAAALTLAFVAVLGTLWLLHASPRRLVLGEDGRYSKSKFQVAVWFITLIAGYLATIGLRWWASDWTLVGGVGIPTDLLVISGISAFTFVGAKSVTVSKMAQSPAFAAMKQAVAPSHFPDDLINDDRGNPDLGDAQMVLITLVAVGTYVATVFSWLGVLHLAAQIQMPNIDSTLVAVFGLGQGAYLVKKQIGS
jgi:hypothetical protein